MKVLPPDSYTLITNGLYSLKLELWSFTHSDDDDDDDDDNDDDDGGGDRNIDKLRRLITITTYLCISMTFLSIYL